MSEEFGPAGFDCCGLASATSLADRRGSEIERCRNGSTLKAEFIDGQVDGDRSGLCRLPASPRRLQLSKRNPEMLRHRHEELLEVMLGIGPASAVPGRIRRVTPSRLLLLLI